MLFLHKETRKQFSIKNLGVLNFFLFFPKHTEEEDLKTLIIPQVAASASSEKMDVSVEDCILGVCFFKKKHNFVRLCYQLPFMSCFGIKGFTAAWLASRESCGSVGVWSSALRHSMHRANLQLPALG